MIEGVFVDIVGSNLEHSSYDIFIKNSEKTPSKELIDMVAKYKTMITKNKDHFEKLAALEEIIMQMRSRENIRDVKLSLVREYVYARCSFYRKDKTSKDIRVIVDNMGVWSKEVDTSKLGNKEFVEEHKHKINHILDGLLKNIDFMTKAKTKLKKAMDKEIDEGVTRFKETYV
jgi:hypothetical protein